MTNPFVDAPIDPDWERDKMANEKPAEPTKPATPAGKPTTPPPPGPTPGPQPPKLQLLDEVIPSSAWVALPDEIDEKQKDKLIDTLIEYINKIDFPPRFKDLPHAIAYFQMFSDKQINRLNDLAKKIKEDRAKAEAEAAKAEADKAEKESKLLGTKPVATAV